MGLSLPVMRIFRRVVGASAFLSCLAGLPALSEPDLSCDRAKLSTGLRKRAESKRRVGTSGHTFKFQKPIWAGRSLRILIFLQESIPTRQARESRLRGSDVGSPNRPHNLAYDGSSGMRARASLVLNTDSTSSTGGNRWAFQPTQSM